MSSAIFLKSSNEQCPRARFTVTGSAHTASPFLSIKPYTLNLHVPPCFSGSKFGGLSLFMPSDFLPVLTETA